MNSRDKSSMPEAAPKPVASSALKEIGWLPDCVYVGGKFESGLAFFADGAGRITRFSREPADVSVAKRLPGQAALPGLINTHSQSWERLLRGRVDWRGRADRPVAANSHETQEEVMRRLSAEDVYDAARMAFLEMLLSGATCVGECLFLQQLTNAATRESPGPVAQAILRAAHDIGIRISLLNGAVARTGFRQPAGDAPAAMLTATAEQFIRETEKLREYLEANFPSDEAWIGIAPQSLATVPLEYLKTVATYAHAKRLRLHLHVGGEPDEHDACVAEYGRSPAALLAANGLLDKRFVALHGTHLTDEDIRILGTAKVAVCVCPSSELPQASTPAIGKLLAAGASLAVGTDGATQASLFDDLRLLEYQLRERNQRASVLPTDFTAALFQAATVAGARSLGATGGALEIGRPADFFTVNLFDPALVGASPDLLLNAVVFAGNSRAIREVWVGARQRVGQWRHPAQSGVIARFGELQKRLWSGQR